MNRALSLSLALLITVMMSFSTSVAQDVEFDVGFLMFNQNQCDDVGAVMDIVQTTTGPILNELQSEGLIANWGVLTHSWGDEWNFNWWMTTENHAGFVVAWSEFVSRTNERHPDVFASIGPLCREHKDNLYTMRTPQQ